MNIYALLAVLFVQLNKKSVNEEKVDVFDQIFIVNAVNFAISSLILAFSRRSIVIP